MTRTKADQELIDLRDEVRRLAAALAEQDASIQFTNTKQEKL